MAVQEFQRVFQGDDVILPGLVDAVNYAGQGGGFAAARRAGHQHHTLSLVG